MYTLEEIDKLVLKSDSANLPDNFVAAAVAINKQGNAFHAGLVIAYNSKNYIFHYTGSSIEFESIPTQPWYFHKPLEFIIEEDISAFFVYCKEIQKEANPKYGYFYGGSLYDSSGKYFSENGDPEIMTCVGFCLNVILGFVETDEYITYDDWNNSGADGQYFVHETQETLNAEEYIEYYVNKFSALVKDTDLQALKANLRRIYPIEYLATAFITESPIRKTAVDDIVDKIQIVLRKKIIF